MRPGVTKQNLLQGMFGTDASSSEVDTGGRRRVNLLRLAPYAANFE